MGREGRGYSQVPILCEKSRESSEPAPALQTLQQLGEGRTGILGSDGGKSWGSPFGGSYTPEDYSLLTFPLLLPLDSFAGLPSGLS